VGYLLVGCVGVVGSSRFLCLSRVCWVMVGRPGDGLALFTDVGG
jgi:hypothetical protein